MSVIWEEQFSKRIHTMKSSAIRELLKVTEKPDIISFGGGLPAPESFPLERFALACEKVLRRHGALALQYGATEGYRPLKERLVEKVGREGVRMGLDNVLITNGSQQALDLLGRVFLNPGDRVVVEAPTYLGALQAWSAYAAEYLIVPTDADGMDTDTLEQALRQKPKFIYVLPNFQNPAGVTLSLERRHRMIELARQYRVPIVEDDPYRQLRFEGEDLPSLLALDSRSTGRGSDGNGRNGGGAGGLYAGNVIYLSTFSKILSPGIRLGWVAAPEAVIRKLVIAKQGTDLHTSTLVQMVAHEMEKDGYLEEHARIIQNMYRERRDAMLAALQATFPPNVYWTHPRGGLFLWCTLPEEIDAEELLTRAIERKVAFVPGTPFYPYGQGKNQMRLNFSFSSPAVIQDGIARLGALLTEYEKVPA